MNVIDHKLAIEKLNNGLPIIFQTDTLPAIGCLPKFSETIYKIKKRDTNKPLIFSSILTSNSVPINSATAMAKNSPFITFPKNLKAFERPLIVLSNFTAVFAYLLVLLSKLSNSVSRAFACALRFFADCEPSSKRLACSLRASLVCFNCTGSVIAPVCTAYFAASNLAN